MPIIKWDPFNELESFLSPRDLTSFTPAMNVYATDKDVVVETSLAAVDPEDVDVTVEDDVLTIKGKTKKESEVEEKNYYRKEVQSGSFYRSVVLPAHVLGDKAKATFEDGLLKITIPKVPEEKKKAVKVKVVKAKKAAKKTAKKRK